MAIRRTGPPADPVLEKAYGNTSGSVAFLDETFQQSPQSSGRFYVFTAVLVEREEMGVLRQELREIAGGTFWHTTDELLTEDGRKRAHSMLEFLGQGTEVCVISHHTTVRDDDSDLERARQECLRGLVSQLAAGSSPRWGSINLIVLEERNPRHRSNLDRKTIVGMRAGGLIPRSTQLVLTSPKNEHLLWLPDVVSSAYRRTLTHS